MSSIQDIMRDWIAPQISYPRLDIRGPIRSVSAEAQSLPDYVASQAESPHQHTPYICIINSSIVTEASGLPNPPNLYHLKIINHAASIALHYTAETVR